MFFNVSSTSRCNCRSEAFTLVGMTVIQFPARRADGPLSDTLAREVKALMGRHDVNQTMLAEWLGINQTAVSARLRGATKWSLDDVERIAEGFAVHPAELMGGYATDPHPFPDGGLPILCACRDSNPKPSDPKVRVVPLFAAA